jgi:hemolysin D
MGALAIVHEALKAERRAPALPARSRDEMSFLPAVLEITETPPSLTARWLAGLIATIFTTAVLWACVSRVDVVATAEGRVVSSGRSKVIQPAAAGIIRAIHIRDGQFVRRGEVLVEFDTTNAQAERQRIYQELQQAVVSAARYRSLSEVTQNEPPAPLTAENAESSIILTQTRLMLSQLEEHHSKLRAIDMERHQRLSEQRTVAAAIRRLEGTIPLISARSEVRADLARSGIGSRLVSLEAQQLLIEARGDLAIQQHRYAELEAALNVLRAQSTSVHAEFQRTNLAALAEAERQADGLRQDLIKADQVIAQTTLTAPIDGTVQQLSVHTISGVVQPSQQLMIIVPNNDSLEVDALILNRDIGFVQEGQAVSVKFETFNFTSHGTISGKVCSVSRDSQTDEKLGSVFAIRVCLDRYTISQNTPSLQISPGMSVSAEIITDERSVISYLLSPLRETIHNSIRER